MNVQRTEAGMLALDCIDQVLSSVFKAGQGTVTASAETQLQHAIHRLRTSGRDPDVLARGEHIAALMATVSQAQRNGRPNLCASQLLRLKRYLPAVSTKENA